MLDDSKRSTTRLVSRVFRGKFVAGLRNALHRGELQFHGELLPLAHPSAFARWLRVLFLHDWVVYSKRPFGGPEHVLRYLGAYTHRVAISNSELVDLSDGIVTFRWRDSAHGNKKRIMTLTVDEFLRRADRANKMRFRMSARGDFPGLSTPAFAKSATCRATT